MTNTGDDRGLCQHILAQLDGYLDCSLSPPVAGAVADHLERCAACRSQAELLRNFRARVRLAVKNTETPAYLETRIRAHLSDRRPGFPRMAGWAAAGTAAAFVIGAAVFYQLGHLRLTVKSQEAYIGTVSSRIPAIMRVGLGDHLHCSVFRRYPGTAPRMEEFMEKMGPEYSGIIPIVRKQTPAELRLMMAHRCRYRGRRFVHLALKGDSGLLSVIIAPKAAGEAFPTEQLAPALEEAGIPIYKAGVQHFQIAAFETGAHLIYVISDFGTQQNLELLRAMAPELQAYLTRLEG